MNHQSEYVDYRGNYNDDNKKNNELVALISRPKHADTEEGCGPMINILHMTKSTEVCNYNFRS